ncbi:MAG: hypothetical protein JXB17_04950 [Bacteroidales bacterium]|nr:hypothetical protein [Bacteroidales bacterium]
MNYINQIINNNFKKPLIFLFISVLVINACKLDEKIIIGDIQEVKIEGIAGQNVFLNFTVPVENNSGMSIKITQVDLDVKVDDVFLGKVSNLENIKIEKKSQNTYTFKLKLKINGIFGVINVMKVFNADKGKLMLSGEIKIKSVGMYKKIRIDEVQEINFSEFKNKLP